MIWEFASKLSMESQTSLKLCASSREMQCPPTASGDGTITFVYFTVVLSFGQTCFLKDKKHFFVLDMDESLVRYRFASQNRN